MTRLTKLPGTRTDATELSRDLARVPHISGEQMQHVGRFAGALVLSAFEQIGGAPRLAQWADENPSDFYTKLFPKVISRVQQVDVSGNISIDDAISKLENSAIPIEAEFTEVPKDFDL